MSNFIRAFTLATSVAAMSLSAQADVVINLDFEALAATATSAGVAVGNTYASSGLVFSSGVNAYNYNSLPSSLSNVSAPASGVGFIAPVNGFGFRVSVLSNFSYNLNSLSFDAAVGNLPLTVSAYDRAGNALSVPEWENITGVVTSTKFVWTSQPGDVFSDLGWIDFTGTGNFAVDNLKFSLASSPFPKNVPEPTGLALVAAALAAMALVAKRKQA
jgi:hypothetical protein